MNLICELNDKLILGCDCVPSEKAPRLASRAVVMNSEGLYALMYMAKHNHYTLPGGGLEDGEEPIEALKREILEETGCICDEVTELGMVCENRGSLDFTQINYYFAVKTYGKPCEAHLSANELADGVSLQWHTFPDLVKLIADYPAETAQKRYIKARDMAALEEYARLQKL